MTVKPRIFISHAGKDAVPGEPEPPPGTRAATLAYARKVRGLLETRLQESYEVWLDKSGLKPGDDWEAKLDDWLGSCDGAAVLLDSESVQSLWVQKEVTVVTWRRDVGAGVVIVPVFLGAFQAEDLEGTLLAQLNLPVAQAAKSPTRGMAESDAEALVDQVLTAFQNHIQRLAETDMDIWIAQVRARLREVNEDGLLVKAAATLGIAREEWLQVRAGGASLVAALAHRLLASTPKETVDALNQLRPGLDANPFKDLWDLVRPAWVDPSAANHLRSALREDERHLAVLATCTRPTVKDHVGRATWCRLQNSQYLPVTLPTGADPVEEGRAQLLQQVASREEDVVWPDDKAWVETILRAAQKERVAVFGPDPNPTLVKRMRDDYKPLEVIAFGGADKVDELAAAVDGTVVTPRLTPDAEQAVRLVHTGLQL